MKEKKTVTRGRIKRPVLGPKKKNLGGDEVEMGKPKNSKKRTRPNLIK